MQAFFLNNLKKEYYRNCDIWIVGKIFQKNSFFRKVAEGMILDENHYEFSSTISLSCRT